MPHCLKMLKVFFHTALVSIHWFFFQLRKKIKTKKHDKICMNSEKLINASKMKKQGKLPDYIFDNIFETKLLVTLRHYYYVK